MTELTLDNLTEEYISENLKEVTMEQSWGNTIQQVTTLFEGFALGRFNLMIGYNPRSKKPWSISGGVGNFKTYKNFTGLKNYIKKTKQYI